MLTRDMLTAEEWATVRDTPHLVMLAVSAADGSPLDAFLERRAGMRSIVEGSNSTHPLVRAIAEGAEIMAAQDAVAEWLYRLADGDRTADFLQERALQSMSRALDVIAERGKGEDMILYTGFVLAMAMRVARAAREGDVLGIGGKRVSEGEASFIRKLEGIAASTTDA